MNRLALPEADWPEVDQTLMASLFLTGGPLDDVGPLCRLRPASQTSLRFAYARWLGWLNSVDAEGLVQITPVARATPERFRRWVASVSHLAPETQLTMAVAVLRAPKAAAPDAEWHSHSRAVSVLRWQASQHRSTRKEGRIVSSALLRAARDKSEAHGLGSTPVNFRSVRARRDAAMNAFLTVMPIRFRSFCHLRIGTSFQVTAEGLRVVLETSNLKSGQHWETPVPSPLAVFGPLAQRPWPSLQPDPPERSIPADHAPAGRCPDLTSLLSRLRCDHAGLRLAGKRPLNTCSARALQLPHRDQHYNQVSAVRVGRDYAGLIARPGNKVP